MATPPTPDPPTPFTSPPCRPPPTAPSPCSPSSSRSPPVHVTSKRPSFHAMSLTMVTVKVGPEALPFVLHKDLLCHHSSYFRGCFNGSFTEAKDGESSHPDVDVTTFRTFVHWLYCKEVLFDGEKRKVDQSLKEAIQVYMFADRFDVSDLRNDIFDIISSYCMTRSGIPWFGYIRYALEGLPDGSPLSKFFIDLMVYKWNTDPDDINRSKPRVVLFSPEVLWHIIAGCKKLLWSGHHVTKETAPYIEDICQYHEHQSEEDKAACKSRKKPA